MRIWLIALVLAASPLQAETIAITGAKAWTN